MKRIIYILLVVTLFSSCKTRKAKSDYVPLSKFNGDTLAYLTYNFEEKTDYYKGRKSSEFFDRIEKEIPLNALYMNDRIVRDKNKNEIRKVTGMMSWLGNERKGLLKRVCVSIRFKDDSIKVFDAPKCKGMSNRQLSYEEWEKCKRNFLSDCKIDKIEAGMGIPKNRSFVNSKLDFLKTLSRDSWERGKYCKYDDNSDVGIQRIEFTSDSIFIYNDKKAKDLYFSSPYYLSYGNTDKVIKKCFNDSAVGRRNDGCYIVVKVDGNLPEYYRIYELSEKKLRIRSVFNFSNGKLMDFYPIK